MLHFLSIGLRSPQNKMSSKKLGTNQASPLKNKGLGSGSSGLSLVKGQAYGFSLNRPYSLLS
jgi:hypothetical protein